MLPALGETHSDAGRRRDIGREAFCERGHIMEQHEADHAGDQPR